jgi:hypothetical protein
MDESLPLWTTRLRLVGLIVVWWLAAPWVEALYYRTELARGAFPPEADSIGLPLGQHFIGWLAFTPVLVAIVLLALRGAPRRFSLLAFDRGRPWWSGGWTVGLGALALDHLWSAGAAAMRGHPADVVHSLVGVVALLALRGAACAPRVGRTVGTAAPAV